MTIKRRSMLAHAFGEEYGLAEPYICEGCHKEISEHCQFAPETPAEEKAHMNSHFSQKHGRPPATQVDEKDVVCCSMHGEHNLTAQTFFATAIQHLWDKKTTDALAKLVNEVWSMKRHTIKQQTGKKAITKDMPHFNGPEGKRVIRDRLDAMKIVHKRPQNLQEAEELWVALTDLFDIWQRVVDDPSKWQEVAEEARVAAEIYVTMFINMCSASDGTVTMHYAMHHWPEHIQEHGSMAAINAQGLEAGNQESKNDGKKHSNRQVKRSIKGGGGSRGRMTQMLARSIMRQYNFIQHSNEKKLWRHVAAVDQKVPRKIIGNRRPQH